MSEAAWTEDLRGICALRCGDFGEPSCWSAVKEAKPCHTCVLTNEGYSSVRQLADGRWAGVRQFIFTWGLCVGLDESGYAWRCCFESKVDAEAAIEEWDGAGWPPGFWVKAKGVPGGDVRRADATEGNAP